MYPAKAALTRTRSVRWKVGGAKSDTEGVRILFYHRVSEDRDELAVKPRRFCDQMRALSGAGYTVLDLESIVTLLDTGEIPPRTIGLSFDDGYQDIAENALPVLELYGFRATVYVSTAVIDGTSSFTWYRHQPPLLSWDDITRLDAQGTFSFEPHTVTHPNLVALGEAQAREEIVESKRILERRLNRETSSFCYPAGLFGERERSLVEQSGFRSAASCEPGTNNAFTDRLALRRIQIDRRDRLVDFRAKVGGGHDSPTVLRSLYRRYRYGASAIPNLVNCSK